MSVALSPDTETEIARASAPSFSMSIALTERASSASVTSVEAAGGLSVAFADAGARSIARKRAAAKPGIELRFMVGIS